MQNMIYVILGSTGSILNQDYECWSVCCFADKDKALTYTKLADARAAEIMKKKTKYFPYDPEKHGVNEYDKAMISEGFVYYTVEEMPLLNEIPEFTK